jgi:hypothetical protein
LPGVDSRSLADTWCWPGPIFLLDALRWSELEEVGRSDGDPNKGPRSQHRATDLELRRSSRLIVVAGEKGEAAEGVVYFFFPTGRGGEGVSECCISHLFFGWVPVLSMLRRSSSPACSGDHDGG